MTFNDRFEELLEKNKITKAALAERLELRKQLFTTWKDNGNLPRADIAIKLAKFFNVSVDYLLTGEVSTNENTPEETRLLSLWRELTDDQKDDILHEMEYKAEKNKKESSEKRA